MQNNSRNAFPNKFTPTKTSKIGESPEDMSHTMCVTKGYSLAWVIAWVVGKRVSLMHHTLRNQRLLFSVDRIIFLAKFYMTRKICDFNHISPELNREQVEELIGYYKTTHQKWFLYKKAHKHYKLIKYASRLTSGAIAGGGIASVIVSGSVLTIISLGASLLIEILLDYKNVNENMNNCKYAYQSYQHLMIQIKTALRLDQYNIQNLVNSISNLDNFLLIFAR